MPQRRITPFLTVTLAALFILSFWQTALALSSAYEDDLIRRAEAQFGLSAALQAGAEPAQPTKCGTPLVYEIRMAWADLSPETRRLMASVGVLERPDLDEYYDFEIADGRFRIHYTRTGLDSVDMSYGVGEGDVPVYVLKCAAYMDTVVTKQVDEMGFLFPVSDSIGTTGEDARFDIYFANLGSGYFGWTTPETVLKRPDGTYVASSWLKLNSNFRQVIGYKDRPFDAMAVTAAHEFHHSIQWTYDCFEAEYREVRVSPTETELTDFPWFFELTSTYMEEVVFDRINDYYTYLPAFFNYPWYSLRLFTTTINAEGLHCYASCVWGIFLSEKFGETVMREIWEECAKEPGFNTVEAFETVLNRHGSSFAEAWAEFLVWNYFTGRRASDSWGYTEGQYYAEIQDTHVAVYETYPVEDSARLYTVPRRPDELAAAYLRFSPVDADSITDFNIQIGGTDFSEWLVVTAGLRGAIAPDISYTTDRVLFDPVTVANWDQYEEVMVIVSPFKQHPDQKVFDRSIRFNYAVQDSFGADVDVSSVRRVYSNPLISSGGSGEPFRIEVALAAPAEVSMYVYTPSGQLIRGGPSDNDASNQMYWLADRRSVDLWWAGTNRNNERVASGVYLALVKIGDKSEIIKVAVINE